MKEAEFQQTLLPGESYSVQRSPYTKDAIRITFVREYSYEGLFPVNRRATGSAILDRRADERTTIDRRVAEKVITIHDILSTRVDEETLIVEALLELQAELKKEDEQ